MPSAGWKTRLARAALRHPWTASGAVAASVLGVAMDAAAPLLLRAAVDGAVDGSTAVLGPVVALLCSLAVLRCVAGFLRRRISGRLALEVQHDLRMSLLDAVHRTAGRPVGLRPGQVGARATTDLQLLYGLLTAVPASVGMAVLVVASFTAMLWLSPLLAVVALLLVPLGAGVTMRLRRSIYPATWSAQQRVADLASHVDEAVAGVRVIKGFAREASETARADGTARRLFAERLRVARLTARLNPVLLMLPLLGQVAVTAVGGVLALRGAVSIGTFLAVTTYVGALIGPGRALGALMVGGQLARAAVERILEVVDAPAPVEDAADPVGLPPGSPSIEFDRVTVSAGVGAPVLSDLSLAVAPGETLAVVGAAGSGKTTLLELLARFEDPASGEVRVGGVPLRSVSAAELRRRLGIVSEEPFLFAGSVRDNIAYVRPGARDDEVRAAARAATVDDVVRALPDGYDTVVGERGVRLSGGQRQRVAVARALLGAPDVLVLDDPTSSVDTETEAALHASLAAAAAGRTTVMVVRRRSSLLLADRIAVLDRGRLVDVGTERELDERCPRFRRLVDGAAGPADPGDPTGNAAPRAADAVDPVPDTTRLWPDPVLDTPVGSPWLRAALGSLPAAVDRPRARRAPPGDDTEPGLRLGALVRPVAGLVALAICLVGLEALVGLVYPWVIRWAVDAGIVPGEASVVVASMAIGVGLVLVGCAVTAAEIRATARAGENLLYSLRVRSFAHLQRLGLEFYERERSGRLLTRLTTDMDSLSTFLQSGLAQAVVGLATILGVAVALALTDVALWLVVMTVVPPLAVGSVVFHRRSTAAHVEARSCVAAVNADLQENLAGARLVAVSGRERHNREQFAVRSATFRDARMRAQHCIAWYFPAVGLLADAAQVAVLAVGASRLAAGTLSAGELTAFLLYLGLFFAPVQQLSQLFDGYLQARVAVGRVAELLRTPAAVPGDAATRAAVPARLRGEVELRDVRFAYREDAAPVIDDVSLRIRAGETVALVGSTGAGKSTLVKLLARFYEPHSGSVLVDGVDIARFPLADYRRRLGIVPQEPYLFRGDLATNIAYGRPEATPAEIEAAAQSAGALELVRSLPGGFRFPLDERGRGLSAGQRQLLALARVELVDPDVVLLDEATAALDPAAEAAVARASARVGARRTTLVVAHRLTTAARADRVVVLREGRVVEVGSPAELLDRDGHFAAMWRAGVPVDRRAVRPSLPTVR